MTMANEFLLVHKKIDVTQEDKHCERLKIKLIKHIEINNNVFRIYIFKDNSVLKGNWYDAPRKFDVYIKDINNG